MNILTEEQLLSVRIWLERKQIYIHDCVWIQTAANVYYLCGLINTHLVGSTSQCHPVEPTSTGTGKELFQHKAHGRDLLRAPILGSIPLLSLIHI